MEVSGRHLLPREGQVRAEAGVPGPEALDGPKSARWPEWLAETG